MARHKIEDTFPRYFKVDDVPVVVYVDPKTGYVAAKNDLGNPEDIAVASLEGRKITEAEFKRMAKERKKMLGSKV